MRAARALKEGATDDIGVLTRQMHEMRAAKEDAERDLGAAVLMYDQMRSDWSKKLKDRRKEVSGRSWRGKHSRRPQNNPERRVLARLFMVQRQIDDRLDATAMCLAVGHGAPKRVI
jgi:hypothetical protein